MTVARWVVILGCVWAACAPAARAEGAPAGDGQPDRVEEVMGRYNLHPSFAKLGRGLANFTGGWLEIPLNMHRRYSTGDTAGSLFTGAIYGVFKGLVRTSVGAYETLTFFLPYPEEFAPILPTLPYFQRETKQRPLPRRG